MNENNELFEKAYKLHQENKLSEAIEGYQKCLTHCPEHEDGLHYLALAQAQQGQLEQAIANFKKALRLNPDEPGLHNNLANVYKQAQQFEQAITHYQKALHDKPDYAQALNNLGALYAQQGQYHEALKHYQRAVHAQPDFAPAHHNLGLLLLNRQELQAARTQFNNVLTLNPGHTEARFYLGVLHLENDALDDAEKAFQEILERDSEHVEALTNLGVIALKRDQGQIAVDYFTKALALDTEHLEARNNLAATFIHHNRFENALMHYDVLLQRDPENIEYHYNMGVAQMALGHLQEATIHFENILSNDKNHFEALNNMAAIYIRLQQKAAAIEYLQQALIIHPNDPATRFMLQALTGEHKQPEGCVQYVSNLFNNYALYYDSHMQEILNYSLPQHIARTLHQLHCLNLERTLDLGCGTGLTGGVLREITHHLIGVDIAGKMLAQAKEKGIYDELIEADILSFLQQGEDAFNLAVAADVLPYLGDLEPLFKKLHARLAKNGLFLFTMEICEDEPWKLQKSARFCHHPDYIDHLCKQFHFAQIHQEKIQARRQEQKNVPVMLYVVKRV